MVSTQILNIQILILSCSYALFELTFWIILVISRAENVTKDRRLSVTGLRFVGSLLLLIISKHWFEKKSLNSPPLCLKPERRGFLWNNGGFNAEAATQTCSEKKLFLESSQNLQENTCARVSFYSII